MKLLLYLKHMGQILCFINVKHLDTEGDRIAYISGSILWCSLQTRKLRRVGGGTLPRPRILRELNFCVVNLNVITSSDASPLEAVSLTSTHCLSTGMGISWQKSKNVSKRLATLEWFPSSRILQFTLKPSANLFFKHACLGLTNYRQSACDQWSPISSRLWYARNPVLHRAQILLLWQENNNKVCAPYTSMCSLSIIKAYSIMRQNFWGFFLFPSLFLYHVIQFWYIVKKQKKNE